MGPAEYVRELYAGDERVATVLVPRGDPVPGEQPKVEQRIWPAATAGSDKVQAWLRHVNARKYDVFLGMNPIRPRVQSRHKRDVLEVARVYLDIDERGVEAVERILGDAKRGAVGKPRLAIESSPGRAQVIWQLERGALEPGRAEDLMRGLVREYGGDRAAVDVSRVLRWPGFRNWKRGGCEVRVTWRSAAVAEPGQFRDELYRPAELPPRERPAAAGRAALAGGGRDTSRSGRDWRWATRALRGGADPDEVARQLERDRPDKANPRYYATLTVRKVRESLSRGR